MKKTCEWPTGDRDMIEYHDKEWGVPMHDDEKLFEYLLLDTFQAGLSWRTILKKRENFRKAFHGWNAYAKWADTFELRKNVVRKIYTT